MKTQPAQKRRLTILHIFKIKFKSFFDLSAHKAAIIVILE